MFRRFIACLLIAVLASCATEPARIAGTKWPEVIVAAPKTQVHEKFLSAFAQVGESVETVNDSMIQIRVPHDNAALAKAMLGCGSCADPFVRVTAILTNAGAGTRVVLQYWAIIPKANGSELRVDMDSATDFNAMQDMLWKVRDKLRTTAQASDSPLPNMKSRRP